jgi:hypothetical protein
VGVATVRATQPKLLLWFVVFVVRVLVRAWCFARLVAWLGLGLGLLVDDSLTRACLNNHVPLFLHGWELVSMDFSKVARKVYSESNS